MRLHPRRGKAASPIPSCSRPLTSYRRPNLRPISLHLGHLLAARAWGASRPANQCHTRRPSGPWWASCPRRESGPNIRRPVSDSYSWPPWENAGTLPTAVGPTLIPRRMVGLRRSDRNGPDVSGSGGRIPGYWRSCPRRHPPALLVTSGG